jgi:protein-S-isoprenylcysteine O-methyltransferase Ste14
VGGALPVAADLAVACWALLEIGLRIREGVQGRGGRERDRGTRVLIAVTLAATIGLAAVARSSVPSLRVPGAGRAAGTVVIWLGLALRIWAVVTLGAAFRTTVEVDLGQSVVSTGPYAWVRHPSYTGLLLIVAGFGLASGNWLAFVVCAVVPLPAVLWRIHVEEAELDRVLGDAYRAYRRRTTRLVPRVW